MLTRPLRQPFERILQQICDSKGICAEDPEKPLKLAAWQYVLTVLSIAGGLSCVDHICVPSRTHFTLHSYDSNFRNAHPGT